MRGGRRRTARAGGMPSRVPPDPVKPTSASRPVPPFDVPRPNRFFLVTPVGPPHDVPPMASESLQPADPEARNPGRLVWPTVGALSAVALVAGAWPPARWATPGMAVGAWWAAMAVVVGISGHAGGARAAAVGAGLLLALPVFVDGSPLSRCLLACLMAVAFGAAAALLLAGPIAGWPARLRYLCSYCGGRRVTTRPRRFDAPSLARFVLSTAVLAAAIAAVKSAGTSGGWLPIRWLAGGVGLLAIAEMASAGHALLSAAAGVRAPSLFRSPFRATSIAEFWSARWNLAASELLRRACYRPLRQHGTAPAMFAAFAVSAAGHALLAGLALGRWRLALACGTFFLLQAAAIGAERRFGVTRWPPAAARAWTLGALAITSPLVVEPLLQILVRAWGPPDDVVRPTAAATAFVLVVTGVFTLAARASLHTAKCSAGQDGGLSNSATISTLPRTQP